MLQGKLRQQSCERAGECQIPEPPDPLSLEELIQKYQNGIWRYLRVLGVKHRWQMISPRRPF